MKSYFQSCLILLLVIFGARPSESYAQSASSEWSGNFLYTLYPVTGFNISWIETIPFLSWQKPELPLGGTPPGLIGYNIYRNNIFLINLSGIDTTWYYEYQNLEPGEYIYAITAYYDLTPYGLPGQFGESDAVVDTIQMFCFSILPFEEQWDYGCFAYNTWEFEPAQENWSIALTDGNPIPAAAFTGVPQITTYSSRLKSKFHCPGMYFCASLYLDFDYKLEDLTAGSTEKMFVEMYYDSTWHTLLELTNQGSTGWIHHSVNISELLPSACQIGFRAEGENSSNIYAYMIDNIQLYAICHPPLNTSLNFSGGNVVTISWEPPCDPQKADSTYFQYFIMRTDSSGLPPFVQISSVITDTFFNNYIAPDQLGGHFRYYVLAEHMHTGTGMCFGVGDTVNYIPILGIPGQPSYDPVLYPNPANNQVIIENARQGSEIFIFDFLGRTMLNRETTSDEKLVVDVSSWPAGVYFVKISTREKSVVRKLSVLH